MRHLHATDRERSVHMNEEVNTLRGALELVKTENENIQHVSIIRIACVQNGCIGRVTTYYRYRYLVGYKSNFFSAAIRSSIGGTERFEIQC